MIIKATYNGESCLLNADYIVDVFNYDKMFADVYILDIDREAYKVAKSELNKWIEYENRTDEKQ